MGLWGDGIFWPRGSQGTDDRGGQAEARTGAGTEERTILKIRGAS